MISKEDDKEIENMELKPMKKSQALKDGLDSFAKTIRYILYEIEANPEDSLRDIANDALMDNKIPLACNMIEGDYEIVPHEWETG